MRLADFIKANAEPILMEWEVFARSIWPGAATDPATLRDHAEQMLHAAVADMASSQSDDQQSDKSKGKGGASAESSQVKRVSAEHGVGRVGSGFDLATVIAEYRALRASVIRLWRESEPATDSNDLADLTRFNEFIDQSLTEAVVAFSQHVEQERTAAFKEQTRQSDELRKLNNELLVSSVRQHEATEQAEQAAAAMREAKEEAETANRTKDEFVAALRNERSRLAAIVEHAPAFICVLRAPEHVFELANERYYEVVGNRDILGKPIRTALPELEGQGYVELLDEVYRTGQTFSGDEMPVMLRRSGDDVLHQRYMNLVYQALRDPDGTITGIFVHGFDVTDLVQSREALQSSETRFRQLADSMPQMVWVTRPDGYHEYYNRRWYEFTGASEGSTDGEGWNGMFHPEDQGRAWASWRHSLSTGDLYEIEYRLRHHSGEYRWTLGRALPIRDDKGKIERWFGTCTDIESLKRLQGERETLLESERTAREEVERASLMKDQFLATLSHELRTPLTAILLWSRLLRTGAVRDASGQAQALEAIEVSAEAQKQLIEDLLDISGMTSGKLELLLQEVELEGVVHAAVEAVRPMAEAKGVELDLTLGRRSGPVQVDPDRIRQVVWNLLNNAVKFTESDGEVRVRVRRLRNAVQIQVQDTGRGISGDFLPYVFDRFRQQDASTTRTVGGLGLGLSISRQIVEMHGGTIRVESDGPGKGATFTVELPLPSTVAFKDKNGSEQPAVVTVPLEPSASLHGVRVLFVEDDPATRAAIQWVLKQAGAEVTAVESAAAAVAAFRTAQSAQRYDVLISDIGLPERNGYQLIADLREIEAQMDGKRALTPALALTAYARPEDREQAIAAGFQTHAAKPVEPAHLITMVASLVVRDGG